MTEIETYPVPDFFGHTVFCDDIRFEMDGKLTFVGVYANGVMPTPADFPLTLPKFCFSLIFNQRKDLFVPSLGLRIFLPGDPEENSSIQAEVNGPQVPPSVGNPTDGEYSMIGSNLVLAPFTIEKPGRIRVRVLREGVLHRIGSLRVVPFTEAQPTASEKL
jgi:hypothetical protein